MKSRIDDQEYILSVKFDNYKEWPPYLEFIDPITGMEGTKNAYPLGDDSFFHSHPCICHPYSRKAYSNYSNVHKDDWSLIGWQQNPKVTTLTNLESMLKAIYARINNELFYKGRMK